jgi:hypothetical protein
MNRHRLFALVATVVLLAGALIVARRNDAAAVATPSIPAQAQGFANHTPDPAFYQDAETASDEHYPPQAQGFLHPHVDPAFYADADTATEPYYPPQAQGFVHHVVDPAFYQDATPADGGSLAALGTAWKLAASLVALGLILALGLMLRKHAMPKLAGA